MSPLARVTRRMRATALLALVTGIAGTPACERGAKSPAEGYARFAEAVRSRDAEQLYDTLDQETQWSWMTVRRAHREAFDIVLSTFPEADRDRQLRRFEAGAVSDDERSFFSRTFDPGRWAELARALPPQPAIAERGSQATITSPAGPPLVFRKGPKSGRWGFAGFAHEAEQLKNRAAADLELTRSGAADYERAASRAGK